METRSEIRPLAVLWKGVALFLVLNFLVAVFPSTGAGRLSLYNRLFPGRERLPFGENPTQAYNLSLFDLDAMFASHILAEGAKPADEYRVLLIGDSSVWGTLLRPEQTLAGQGFSIADARPSIQLTYDIRQAEISPIGDLAHPFLKNAGAR